MIERLGLRDYLRSALVPTACLIVIAYFAYHAVEGNTGLLAWGGYKAEHARLDSQAAELDRHKAAIDRNIALLDPRRVDPDYADELVRANLGVVRNDEVVLELPKKP